MRGPSVIEGDVDLLLRLLAIEPLTRTELVAAFKDERAISDSAVRVVVEEARARGQLVIHDGDRYRMAGSFEEYVEWRDRDPLSRARRLLEQVRRMDETASRTWPEQLRLTAA